MNLVLKSNINAKEKYYDIFKKIMDDISSPESKWCEKQFIEALLNDILLTYISKPNNEENYKDAVTHIVSLFQSYCKSKKKLNQEPSFDEMKIKYPFQPPEIHKILLPSQLNEAMKEVYNDQSPEYTHKILLQIKALWISPVFGEYQTGIRKKKFAISMYNL